MPDGSSTKLKGTVVVEAKARHYGLDWLRIGAFGLLILYHIGMFFVPWEWHVKTARPLDWVAIPMLATNSWRLALLFLVSGFASATILKRNRSTAHFLRERSVRLMIPVTAAAVLIIPPQLWVELIVKHDYARDLIDFWLNDYFRFGELGGLVMPTWQHLWFVVYLWVYTLALALLSRFDLTPVQALFDRLFGGIGLLLIPMAWGLVVTFWLGRGVPITHGLFDDPTAHLTYVPAFLFGAGLASSPVVLTAARRWWKVAALLAVAAFAVVVLVELQWPGTRVAPPGPSDWVRGARAIQGWAAIVALIGIADHYWNRDHPWRATLTEAVFPFYIIHQTIIVWLGWYLLRFALPAAVEFAILLAATSVGCALFYWAGRSVGWVRPLIGLRRSYSTPSASSA